MHTGTISFADRIAYNIKSSDTKDEILRELEARFNIRILRKHWDLLDARGLQHLKRAPHLVCLRSNGNPYYMYFTRYEDVPIIYFIDKKVQPGYEKPRIILARGMFDESIFSNTLMEGEMVRDKSANWIFLINDVIAFKGKHLNNVQLPHRLEIAFEIFGKHYKEDPLVDVCSYHVKRFAYATREGIAALMSEAKGLPYTSRGLYFWPFYIAHKPKLHNFDASLIKEVVRKVKDNPEFRTIDAAPSSASSDSGQSSSVGVIDVQEEGEAICALRKTEKPDIYEVYIGGTKTGIAHVASLAMSKRLHAIFKDRTVAVQVPFKCRFNAVFQKWEPLEMINAA